MSNCYRPKRDAGMKFGDYAMTLDQVAQEFGVSRERIRQIENRALAKARVILGRRGYTLQDLLGGDHHG